MARLPALLLAAPLLLGGCASHRLASADLGRVERPAFVSRVVFDAGPQADVFRADASYAPQLKTLTPEEADRRLAQKVAPAMSRFELSERLRLGVQLQLPRERPWTRGVEPEAVASALDTFLVEEASISAPRYARLAPLGADAVVELVVEAYGLRSKEGKAGAFLRGYARLFRLDGEQELWRMPFTRDQLEEGGAQLDPFLVAREPARFRAELERMLDGVAHAVARELAPADRLRRPEPLEVASPEPATAPPETAPRPVSDEDEPEVELPRTANAPAP